MPVPTAPTTAVASQPARASLQFNALALQAAWLLSPPIAILRQTVAQAALTTGVFTSILMDTEDIDRDGGHSTVTNTSRYTAVTAGWYHIDASVSFAANATGRRSIQLLYTTAALVSTAVPGSGRIYVTLSSAPTIGTSAKVFMNVGDFVEVQGFQDSGAGLQTNVSGSATSCMHVAWISQ